MHGWTTLPLISDPAHAQQLDPYQSDCHVTRQPHTHTPRLDTSDGLLMCVRERENESTQVY